MRTRKIILFLAAYLCAACGAAVRTAYAETEGANDMQRLVESMQPGWNLGNTLDATGGETSWGNPATTKEMIDAIAAAGFKSIRVPITWNSRVGAAPDYTITPAFFDRVREIVGWALDDGMYVVINLHHDSEWLRRMVEDHDATLDKYKAIWTQIAQTLGDLSPNVIFEGINEPRFSENWGLNSPEFDQWLDELNTSFYDIVRASGGINATRPLVFTTLVAGTEQVRMDKLYETIERLHDPYLIATVHYYGHYHFSVNVGGATTFNDMVRRDVDAMLERCVNTFMNNGIPVYIGEYGLLAFDRDIEGVEHGEILKYFDYITYAARERGITLMLWDNGQHFDRRALVWRDPSLLDTIIFNTQGRSSVGERDHILLKKQALITDTAIRFEAHDAFTGVRLQLVGETGSEPVERTLTTPADYTYDNDTLTITAAFLLSLPSHPLGETARLVCSFASGPDWVIHVIPYDTPVLEASEGIGTLRIPVAFNGDRLSTMQAYVLQDGKPAGNAGLDDWSPFKMMSRDFKPSYTESYITVTGDFFHNVSDGDYLLRFWFLSGEKIEYTVTKDGKNVTGTPLANEKADNTGSGANAASAGSGTGGSTSKPATSNGTVSKNESITDDDTNADTSGHWISRAWRNPAVKIGAGVLVVVAIAARALLRGSGKRK